MPLRAQLQAALAIAALVALLALFHLGDRLMKKLPLLVACVAAAALAGCGTMIPAADQSVLAQALAAKIPYCSGDIQVAAGIGGIAGTGTGITNAGQLHCPGKAYEATPAGAAAAPAVPPVVPAAPSQP